MAPGVILNHRPGVLKRAAIDGAAVGAPQELRRTANAARAHVLTSMMEKTAMAAGSRGARHLYYGRTP